MNQQSRLAVYQAQVSNVRGLRGSMRQVRRAINAAIRTNDQPAINTFTKLYALMFCAWAEANFIKAIFTPHGLDLAEIEQVLAAKTQNIKEGWKSAITLGLTHLDSRRGRFAPNAREKLDQMIVAHVVEPSLMRNKLAHGQWEKALNRSNDAVNTAMTAEIACLNLIVVERWMKGHEILANALETLIESPKKAFVRDWLAYTRELEAAVQEASQKTFTAHAAKVRAKTSAR